MSRALLIVDVQNDFTEGGALAVDGGTAVARAITRHLADEAEGYDLVVASRDWHDADNDNGGHFATTEPPNYVDTWPVHCVADTPGADFHPDLDTSRIEVEVKKGQGRPSYSAFEGIDESGAGLADILFSRDIDAIDVVGIATDHCVRASARDALEAGLEVTVLAGLTAGVAPQSTRTALAELSRAGCAIEGEPVEQSA